MGGAMKRALTWLPSKVPSKERRNRRMCTVHGWVTEKLTCTPDGTTDAEKVFDSAGVPLARYGGGGGRPR
jgi:hypothetical protein